MAYLPPNLPRDDTPLSTTHARARETGPGLFRRIRDTLQLWRQRRSERDALSRLTERELRDMRLSRYDVETEVRKPFWRD